MNTSFVEWLLHESKECKNQVGSLVQPVLMQRGKCLLHFKNQDLINIPIEMSCHARKPVFVVADQILDKPACKVTEYDKKLEILDLG